MAASSQLRPQWCAAALTACVLALAAACSDQGGGPRREGGAAAVPITVAAAQLRPTERTIDVVGTLYGDEEATVSAKSAGRVVQIFADVGDYVPAGGPLAQIDPRDYELAVAQRRAALLATLASLGLKALPEEAFDPDEVPEVQQAIVESENAEARLARARTLFQQSPPRISEQDYADLVTAARVAAGAVEVARMEARSRLADARTRSAELAQAEQALADTIVRAPGSPPAQSVAPTRLEPVFAVAQRRIAMGEYVTPGTPMFAVVDTDPIKFRAPVPERFAGQVAIGQTAYVKVESLPNAVEGCVSRIAPQIDPATRTFQVEVQVPNAQGLLRPGAFARAAIVTRIEEGVIFVPDSAVMSFAGVSRVFEVSDGRAAEHRVETGLRQDGWVEIVSGLDGPVTVANSGLSRLTDGVAVVIQSQADETNQAATAERGG